MDDGNKAPIRRSLEAPLHGALTVDLEDWRCALDPLPNARYDRRPQIDERYMRESAARLLDELSTTGTKATFFVLGEVARSVPDVVKDISRRGHEIASHSPVHLPVGTIPREVLERMIQEDVLLLEELTGYRPKGFRAPYLALNRRDGWLLESLARLGFLYDSSVAPTWTPYWGIPSAPKAAYFPDISDISRAATSGDIIEFPLTVWPTWRWLPGLPIAGGFYMRAFPTSVLIWMMRKDVGAGFPLNIFVHQGNLDADKERVSHPSVRDRISQYAGARRGLPSFRSVIREFSLGTLSDLHKNELDLLQTRRNQPLG